VFSRTPGKARLLPQYAIASFALSATYRSQFFRIVTGHILDDCFNRDSDLLPLASLQAIAKHFTILRLRN
jgi:hypothetical protein